MKNRWLYLSLAVGIAAGCAKHGSSGPPSGSSSAAVAVQAPVEVSKLDPLFDAAWSARGLSPAAEVDDATYLRRVSIDLVGRIPTVAELQKFTADTSAGKRMRIVDELLDSPEHAKHLARLWDRVLLGPEVKNRVVDRGALRRWLEGRFLADAPWDEVVRELVAAEGKTSVGGEMKVARLGDDPARAEAEKKEGVNGATNFSLRYAKSPQDMAGQTSKVFLGVQIQCAQCHDHKTEKWKRDDFRAMAASFTKMKVVPIEREKREMPIYEIESSDRPAKRLMKDAEVAQIAKVTPRALDGTDLSAGDPRKALAKWITGADNPWFAKASVNRVWAQLMGEGFVNPVDDMRPGNEAIMPEVLEALAEDFEANHYDLDWLYRTICSTKAYQREAAGGAQGSRASLFSHTSLRPMGADELLDSIFTATEVDKTLEERAPARVQALKTAIRRRMGFVFEEDAESNAESYDGTLQQAFFTMNGALPVAATTYREGSVLEGLLEKSDEEAIEALYLRTLGRSPRPEEIAAAKNLLGASTEADPDAPRGGGQRKKNKKKGGKGNKQGNNPALPQQAMRSEADTPRERGFEDLFWALINSSEFTFRR